MRHGLDTSFLVAAEVAEHTWMPQHALGRAYKRGNLILSLAFTPANIINKGLSLQDKLKESLFDNEVDISDDVYIIKAADAQKLLEPPRLAKFTVRPEQVTLKIGEQASFSCAAVDQYGQPFSIPEIAWSGTGGMITGEGLFTARETGGVYTVRAEVAGQESLAEIRIITKDDPPVPPPPPGEQIVRWRGTVPPQKWMNFYTKVLTRFASTPGLKLEVSFEVPIDREQAKAKTEEARAGLKELGLDDNVNS